MRKTWCGSRERFTSSAFAAGKEFRGGGGSFNGIGKCFQLEFLYKHFVRKQTTRQPGASKTLFDLKFHNKIQLEKFHIILTYEQEMHQRH